MNPDEHFVSCSREKDIRSVIWWDAVAHRAVWTEGVLSRPTCLDTSRDGTRIVVGSEAGTIVVIQVSFIETSRCKQFHRYLWKKGLSKKEACLGGRVAERPKLSLIFYKYNKNIIKLIILL